MTIVHHFHTGRDVGSVDPEVVNALLTLEVCSEAWDHMADLLGRDLAGWRKDLANAASSTALSSASQIKPTSLSCPSGHQSTFAGEL